MDGCILLLHIMLPFLLCTAVVISKRIERSTTITILHYALSVQFTLPLLSTMKFLRELMKFCANRPTNTLTSPRPRNLKSFVLLQQTQLHHGRLLQHGSLCHPPTHNMGCLSCGIFLTIIFTTVCSIIVSGQETLLAPFPSYARIGNGK